MTRTRTLLAAWIAAALTLLALAGGASAADYIPGAQVSYYSSGTGQFYAYYYAHHGGGSTGMYLPPFSSSSAGTADAGITLAVYSADGTSATTYGLHGQQPFLNLTPPTRTGNGTSTPYVLESQYYAGDYDLNGVCQGNPCLRVTEQVQYQSTSPDFLFFTYKVSNDGTSPAKFRLTAAADTNTAGGVGTGFFESGTPRAVGTVNERYGASVAYQEVASSSWDHWQEGLPFEIWRRVEAPITSGAPSAGLNDTPNGGAPTTPNGDKAMAVQWDDYVSTGLAGGANHDFQVYLRYNDYDSVVLTNPGYVMTDANKPVTVSLDVKDQYGNAVPLQANDVHYVISYGPNAPVDQSWQVQAPSGGTGHAAVTWNWNSTKLASSDEVDFWIDLNHDGVEDDNEPQTYQYVNWYDGFRLSSQYSSRIIGNTNQVYVTSYNTSHTTIGRDFKWKVTGANPNTNAGDPVNGLWDCTGACNLNPITLNATNAGIDHVEVWEDINGDLDYADYGEKRIFDVTWLSGLRVISDTGKHTKGSGNFSVTAALQATNGSAINGVPLYYRVAGANPQGTSSCATGATLANPATENTACKTALTAPGSYTGGNAPIQLLTATEGEDVLTVWQEVDGVPGTGPTSGDHVIATGNYVTALSPDQRLTTNAGTSTVNRTTGDPFNLTTTLKLANGTADGRAVQLRYYLYSNSPDYAGNAEQEIANDGSGHATIPLPDAGGVGCDDLYIYADLNGNDQQDVNEPYDSPYICWRDRVTLSPDYTRVYQPNSDFVEVLLQHADGSAYDGDYTWTVDGGAPQTGTTFSGYDYISVPSQSVGPHTLHVEFDDPIDLSTQSKDIVLTWATKQSLTLTPEATDASTGAVMHVTAALTNYNGGPAANTLLHYQVYGANDDSGKKVVETDAAGHATIAWTGTHAGGDTLYVWPDYNANGIKDPNEQDVLKTTDVTFHERVEVTPAYDSNYENNQETVTVKFHDDLYNELANQWLTYRVTGANPISAPLVKTDAHGVATISWTGKEPGDDELVVWQDTDGDSQPDTGEVKSPPMDMHWWQRLSASPSTFSTQHTGTAFTINTHLYAANGSDQSGAVLRWQATGASTASGSTPATDVNGDTSFQINSDVAGHSDITVFLDSNGNGTRDAGEPRDQTYVNWTNEITLSCSGCSQTKPEGNTQTVTATKNPLSLPGTLYYRVEGANPVPKTAYTGTITLTGSQHGTDRLYVWADTGGSTDQEPGDVVSAFYETWTPRIDLQGGDGYRVAGGTVSIAVQHLNASGLPTNTAGTTLNYTVTGKNPKAGSVQTNSQGRASIAWTGDNAGLDTLTVTDGTFTSTETVYWYPPPVTLSLVRSDANPDYPTRSHSVTATINGVTIPPAGFPIHFTVSGANSASQTVQSNAAGVATFNWTPSNDGTDNVSAYADVSGTTSYDGFDPAGAVNVTWKPLFVVNTTTSDQAIGEPHTETITFLDNSGNPLPDGTDVLYQISGANPTAGTVLQARPVSTDAGAQVHAKISGGQASVTWTGVNSGTDTLDVWADTDASQTVTGTDPHATRTITWRTATASSAPPGGGTPIGTVSQVTPGSANDFDGVATPPPPVVAKSVNVAPVSGHVFVRLPGKKNFIELLDAEQIPVGSIVDVRKGTVALTSAQNLKGGVATAQFYAGQFQIAQKKAAKPITDLLLYGGSFKGCAKFSSKSSAGTSQKKKIRELWGSGKGQFRTKGKYAAAAVRGTKWDVVDYCDGTLVKVAQGLVQVEPIKGKARLLKAPKSLFVPVAGLAKKK